MMSSRNWGPLVVSGKVYVMYTISVETVSGITSSNVQMSATQVADVKKHLLKSSQVINIFIKEVETPPDFTVFSHLCMWSW